MPLKVDTDKYLQELIHECTKLDMNEDPEVDNIKEPKERAKVTRWLHCRLKQLDQLEIFAKMSLEKACIAGFLPTHDFGNAVIKYHEAYEQVREQARAKYAEVMGAFMQPK